MFVCRQENKQAIEEWVAIQFLFDKQWSEIRVSASVALVQVPVLYVPV